MPSSTFLYELHNVCWSKGAQPILKDLSINLPKRQVVGIIGPNGAGKTSLLRLLNGQEHPTEGTILFGNTKLAQLSLNEKAKAIAFAAQHPDFSFSLDLIDVIKSGRLPHRKLFSFNSDNNREVYEALNKFDLGHLGNRPFNTLSGGEQQRAFLARTLVQQAETILLDEPTNHLDIHYQLQLMQDLATFNGNVVLTLHDLNFAAQYCDFLVLLNKGKLVKAGTPDEILTPEILEPVYQVIVRTSRLANNKIHLAYCLPEVALDKGDNNELS